MSVTVRAVTADEFLSLVPGLVDLLVDIVDDGASLGFVPPVVPAAVRY